MHVHTHTHKHQTENKTCNIVTGHCQHIAMKVYIHVHVCIYLCTHEFIGLDGLHERHCVRVELVGLVGLVHDGKWHTEAEPLEVAHLHTHTHTHIHTHTLMRMALEDMQREN